MAEARVGPRARHPQSATLGLKERDVGDRDRGQTAHGAGHDSHGGHGHSDHPPTSTGLNSRKMLMWLFLTSDCMFFGTLIATYMTYRNRSIELGTPPYPNQIFDIPYTSVSAFVLLMSSLTMVLALSAIQRGNHRGLRIWIWATALLGAIFVGGQFFEFTAFAHEGLTLSSNIFGSSFYVLTGFHGAHVTIGVVWLLSLLVRLVARRAAGGEGPRRRDRRALLALRRHRLDRHLHPRLPGSLRGRTGRAAEAAPHAFLRLMTSASDSWRRCRSSAAHPGHRAGGHPMADHAAHGHEEPADEGMHAHPTDQTYVRIAIILAIITLVEVVIYYLPAVRPSWCRP